MVLEAESEGEGDDEGAAILRQGLGGNILTVLGLWSCYCHGRLPHRGVVIQRYNHVRPRQGGRSNVKG